MGGATQNIQFTDTITLGYEDFIPSYWNGISRMTINDCDLIEYSFFSSFRSVKIEASTPTSHRLAGHTPSAAAANVSFLTESFATTTAAARTAWHQIPLQLSA